MILTREARPSRGEAVAILCSVSAKRDTDSETLAGPTRRGQMLGSEERPD